MPVAINTIFPGMRPEPRGFCGAGGVAVGIDAGFSGVEASSFGENSRGISRFALGFCEGAVTAGTGWGAPVAGSGGLSYSGEYD